MNKDYSRNLIGYGANPPNPQWPGNARVAVSFVLNYEEGGERCLLHGDDESEAFLSEIPSAQPIKGERHISMESIYEYGSRVGVWRVLRLFDEYEIPLTVFAVAMAIERHPDVAKAMVEAGHEICSHGYRWIDYQYIDESEERDHMTKAIEIIQQHQQVELRPSRPAHGVRPDGIRSVGQGAEAQSQESQMVQQGSLCALSRPRLHAVVRAAASHRIRLREPG